MLPFTTSRLLLRAFQETDPAACAAYRSKPAAARCQPRTSPSTRDQATAFVHEMERAQAGAPGTSYQVAVDRQDQPGLVGDCAFQARADDERQAQVGFTFSPTRQQQGDATDAVRGLLTVLFGKRRLHRVTATRGMRVYDRKTGPVA